jgi:hypothetical protein
MKVLVPDELGVKTLSAATNLEPIRYEPGDPWPSEHLDATVVVVGGLSKPSTPATTSGFHFSPTA